MARDKRKLKAEVKDKEKTALKKKANKKEKPVPREKRRAKRTGKAKGKIALQTPVEEFLLSLTEAEQERLKMFFADVDNHIALRAKEKHQMREDYVNALLYYKKTEVSLEDALERLNVVNLGGFYARPPILWYALDDAAKIYPLSIKHGQMSIFRLSAYFKQDIVPEILQMALTFTIKRFPSFATTVKKGFFWHFLDTAKRRFTIAEEFDMPCRPLAISQSGSQSFRVLYYNNRLSVEYFHILTDGTGGMVFLKTLTAEYLRLLGVERGEGDGIFNINDIPEKSETANEFLRAGKKEGISGFVDSPAVQMSGSLSRFKPFQILHFKMEAASLKAAAKASNGTITAYLLALMFIAGKSATDETEGNINIQVPVNMRKFYPSSTVRNFSMYCGIKLPIESIGGKDSMLGEIARQLENKASRESMSEMMASTERMVKMMRYIPLFIKTPAAKIVYGFLGDRVFSNTLSNIGVVTMPEHMAQHIDSMDFVLGTAITNRASCALVTFNNTATLSITKMTSDPSFEEKLYSLLINDGIKIVVEGSERYEG